MGKEDAFMKYVGWAKADRPCPTLAPQPLGTLCFAQPTWLVVFSSRLEIG